MLSSRLLLVWVAQAAAFKGMSNWKLPSMAKAMKDQEAVKRFGNKKLVVVTGTSSGLGCKTAKALLRTGKYHVVGAVRDMDKMEAVAELEEVNRERFEPPAFRLTVGVPPPQSPI